MCVFRIKGRPIVDFPGRYLSDSPRHSRRHLRFSILRKRTRPLDTYYALRSSSSSPPSPSSSPRSSLMSASSRLSVSILRELSHSSCAGPEKSNEALVGSTNVHRPRDPWRTRYVNLPGGARGIIHGIAQGGPVRSSGSSMTYLLATTVTDESARIVRVFLRACDCSLELPREMRKYFFFFCVCQCQIDS